MRKHFVPVLICLLALSLSSFAQPKKSAAKQTASGGPVPDKAFMQKVLDGWSTLDPADAAKFYNHSAGPFFDITPLKYDTWDDYENGVRKILADYQSIKFTANDDAVVHVNGDCAWGTATVKEDAMLKSGKREMATLRWTVIWEKQGGKWLIVHDHVSEPLP
jgi:ketosteroid isomerase-like protein